MDVIFVATIEHLDKYYKYYQMICNSLKSEGCKILDDWIAIVEKDTYKIKDMEVRKEMFYEDYRVNLTKTNFVICDISVVSRTVSYQIAMSLIAGRPTLCLKKYNSKSSVGVLSLIKDKNLVIEEYKNEEEIKKVIHNFIKNYAGTI